jgi:maltose alpha-D-glucosyltransferase/alpha-amylase
VNPSWYKNAIIYAVDVDRFFDSDGDGVGDFDGLISKLDYLADLGVTALWLLPFYPAPDRDNGYDIKDYYGVDNKLGSLNTFHEFVRKAGERSIRVVSDIVMNHTSDQHPWFQAARRDPESRYHHYYTWADQPPPVPPDEGNIFPGQETSVWTYEEIARKYYFHRFYHFQPDLNFACPDVQDEVQRVLDFWLSFGVAGFRIDAASHMIAHEGVPGTDQPDRHGILRRLRSFVEERQEGTLLLGESDVEPEKLAAYFGDGDELTMLFNFALNNYLWLAFARGEAEPIIRLLRQLPALPETAQWGNFLRNLDEVDLERLSEEEREEVYAAFAPEEEMRIFGRGIRRRLAPMLGGDRGRIELAYSLLFTLPGTPVLVYGDEIGLGEDLSRDGRSAVRVPMQWASKRNGGFSSAKKADLVQPVEKDGPFGYKTVNVEAQRADPDSLWHRVRAMIYARRAAPELGNGSWHLFDTGKDEVLAHRSAWKDGVVIAVHNLSGEAQEIELELRGQEDRRLRTLINSGGEADGEEEICSEKHPVALGPYGYRWYRIHGERS